MHNVKPILVNVHHDGDLFFAENETLNVYGTGDTPQNAIHDLVMHIVHFFKYYKNIDESKLMGNALKLKALYQNSLGSQKKVKHNEVKIRYDKESDVLYGSIGQSRKSYGEDVGDDIIIEFDARSKKVAGFIIINFKHRNQQLTEVPFFPKVKLPRIK